jgi:hypothetical protein
MCQSITVGIIISMSQYIREGRDGFQIVQTDSVDLYTILCYFSTLNCSSKNRVSGHVSI